MKNRYFGRHSDGDDLLRSAGGGGGRKLMSNGVAVEDLTASSETCTVIEPNLDAVGDKKNRRHVVAKLRAKNDASGRPDDRGGTNRRGDKFRKKFHRPGKIEKRKDNDKEEELEPIPVPEEKLDKYYRDEPVNLDFVKTKLSKSIVKSKEAKFDNAMQFTAKSELMLGQEGGFIQADVNEDISTLSQHQILKNVDLITKQKVFDLKLDKFGPYRINYTRNGRYLAMAGGLGHVACFDWLPKRLMFEVNVKERCRDVTFLHQETMLAVAQRRLYIYDNQGIEIHCIKQMENVERLEFLPYHFLLTGIHESGYLTYLDVSVGKIVASFPTREVGPLNVMCQNPTNAIIHLGHRGGTVTLWSPNARESLVKMLCHTTPVQSVAVDPTGTYMATSAVDRRINLWDLRQQSKKLATLSVPCGASSLSFSQRGLLAASFGQTVQILDPKTFIGDVEEEASNVVRVSPYLSHSLTGQVENVRFCPFEDVLAIGYETGVASILVPGSGEPNFDALEVNPFMTKKQRREIEVRQLLDKVQPELIDLDPSRVLEVHRPSVHKREENRQKLLLGKPGRLEIEPRFRVRGLPIEKRKRILKNELLAKRKREVVEQKKQLDSQLGDSKNDDSVLSSTSSSSRIKKAGKTGAGHNKTGIEGVLSRFSKRS